MLIECMEKIGEYRAVRALRAFLRSAWFLALVVFLMVLAEVFSWELTVFYLYLVLGLLIVLFGDDLFPLVPIVLCCYMAISYPNNPALFPAGSATPSSFYDGAFVFQIAYIIAVAVLLIAARLIVILMRGEKKKVPALAIGFGALGLSLVLGGLFTKFYDFRTALFGFTVVASLCALYFLFYYGIDWKKTDKRAWAYPFFAIGCGLLFEVIDMYVRSGILQDPSLNRGVLQVGWGMYNNVGCALAMCLPAAFYLALKEKHGWVFTLVGCVQAAGLLFTQSRSSILFGGILGVAALVVLLAKCEKRARKFHLIVLGAGLAIAAILVAVMWDKFVGVFKSMIDLTFGNDPSNARGPIYEEGWRHFRSAPSFGVGFYQCTAYRWGDLPETAFLPRRYHNTVIQLLASGGIFAVGCYILHRVETLVLFFRKPTVEKVFIALSVGALLLTSMVECHLFSLGPGMLYGTLLAFAEGGDRARLQE